MSTKVVNIRRSKFDVYIGRAGKGQDGTFGNPIVVGRLCARCQEVHVTGGSTLKCYKEYFLSRMDKDPAFKQKVLSLKGKTIACFCKPAPCHGDVMAEWLDKQE